MSTVESELGSSALSRGNRYLGTMAGDNSLPESYHLDGGGSYGVWSYRMKNLLQRDGRFHYCLIPPSAVMTRKSGWLACM